MLVLDITFPKRPPDPYPLNTVTHDRMFCFAVLVSCAWTACSARAFAGLTILGWVKTNTRCLGTERKSTGFSYLFLRVPRLTGNYSIPWSSRKCCLTICEPLLSQKDTGQFGDALRTFCHQFCQGKLIKLLITVKFCCNDCLKIIPWWKMNYLKLKYVYVGSVMFI